MLHIEEDILEMVENDPAMSTRHIAPELSHSKVLKTVAIIRVLCNSFINFWKWNFIHKAIATIQEQIQST